MMAAILLPRLLYYLQPWLLCRILWMWVPLAVLALAFYWRP